MVQPGDIPADYYLRHFRTLFDLVWEYDRELFSPRERTVLRRVRRLGRQAQCLAVRLLTRRAGCILRSSLRYPEIEDIDSAIEELRCADLLAVDEAAVAHLGPAECLCRITVSQLHEIAKRFSIHAAGRKPEIVERVCSHPDAVADFSNRHRPLVLMHRSLFDRVRVLFFGNRRQDLSAFIVELLEHSKHVPYRVHRTPPRFRSRAELETYLWWGTLKDADVGQLETQTLQAAAKRSQVEPPTVFSELVASVGFECARELERRGDVLAAATTYTALSGGHGAPVTACRAIDRLGLLGGRTKDASSFATARALSNAQHWDAASQFRVESRAHRLGLSSDPKRKLGCPHELVLEVRRDPARHGRDAWGAHPPTSVEEAVLAELGRPGLFAENGLMRSLFSLLLWDVLFTDVPGAFIQPFQAAPLDFDTSMFARRRREPLDARIQELSRVDLVAEVTDTWLTHYGEACAWVNWSRWSLPVLAQATAAVGRRVVAVIEWIAAHPTRHGRGLPDLLVWDAHRPRDSAHFIEVKAPGDQLRLEQRIAHDRLLKAGYPVSIARVVPRTTGS